MTHTQNESQIQCNPYQNPNVGFRINRKTHLKFLWTFKGLRITKNNLENEERAEEPIFPGFKTYCKGIVIKILWH